jgi:hypothetical protein
MLDACVLFPTVMRELLVGAAGQGLFRPAWTARILEEWARAVRRLGPAAEPVARAEIAALRAAFPGAEVPEAPHIAARLHLPDDNDLHVLAAAIACGADGIVTLNAADFPRGTLAAEGLVRRDPDGLLWELASHHPQAMAAVGRAVQARAEAASGQPQPLAALLKRARLHRLGKLLG